MRSFARSALSRDKNRLIDIRITDMGGRDVAWWDMRIGARHLTMPARADRYWSWSALLPMCHLVQIAKRRSCRPLVIWARADNRRFLRVGMSILIESYPYLDVYRKEDSHFVWFISAADGATLESQFGMSHPPALGQLLLDNAVVLSQNAGLGGRIGLHAAGAGGKGLIGLYDHLGLIRLPEVARMPLAIKRKSDGRFFYADESRSEMLAELLDARR